MCGWKLKDILYAKSVGVVKKPSMVNVRINEHGGK